MSKGDIVITAQQRYASFKSGFSFGATGKPLHHAGLCGVPSPASKDDFELGHTEGREAFKVAMKGAAEKLGLLEGGGW